MKHDTLMFICIGISQMFYLPLHLLVFPAKGNNSSDWGEHFLSNSSSRGIGILLPHSECGHNLIFKKIKKYTVILDDLACQLLRAVTPIRAIAVPLQWWFEWEKALEEDLIQPVPSSNSRQMLSRMQWGSWMSAAQTHPSCHQLQFLYSQCHCSQYTGAR